jgi:hypothetical protein
MALRPADRDRGLAAFNEARATRRRAIVFGRVRVREVATRFWIFTFIGIGIFSVIYYHYTEIQLAAQKDRVMAQQRAIMVGMGQGGFVLRDKLEGWVKVLAESAAPDWVAPEAALDSIANGPGMYLRLPLSEAKDVEAIRRAAERSLQDGFTSCLFIGKGGDPKEGVACTVTSQCGPGELCNGWSVCAPPSQPYNARILYRALRVLEPAWVGTLEAARNDLDVRAIELDLEDAGKHEVVAAAELVRRSKYFTAVLDEPSESPPPAPAPGLEESPEESLQATEHFLRVGIWDIERGEALVSARVEAAGRFLAVGSRNAAPLKVQRAQQRQANNCAAATEVRELLNGAVHAAAAPPEVAPSDATPSDATPTSP